MRGGTWTEDELAILRAHYIDHDYRWTGWELLLPDRTCEAISSKARDLGLTCLAPKDEDFVRKRSLEPVDKFVLRCLQEGMTVSEIDELNKWVPGKAKRILIDIWRFTNG